jgi:hypothetical protein
VVKNRVEDEEEKLEVVGKISKTNIARLFLDLAANKTKEV